MCGCRERGEVERDSEEADELEMIILNGVFDFFSTVILFCIW